MGGENKRRVMTRYESGERCPKEDRLLEIANVLNININCIQKGIFNKFEDIIYFLLWLEELYPKMNIDLVISEYFRNDRDNNRCNSLIAVYTREAKNMVIDSFSNSDEATIKDCDNPCKEKYV